MQGEALRKLIPLIVTVALLAGLAATFGPGLLRAASFRSTMTAFIADVRSGNLSAVLNHVDPSESQEFGALLQLVPADYHTHIRSLKLTTYEYENDQMWAILTGRGERDGDIYQVKLLWEQSGGQWRWEPMSSYGAGYSFSGEPEWQTLPELINQVLSLL